MSWCCMILLHLVGCSPLSCWTWNSWIPDPSILEHLFSASATIEATQASSESSQSQKQADLVGFFLSQSGCKTRCLASDVFWQSMPSITQLAWQRRFRLQSKATSEHHRISMSKHLKRSLMDKNCNAGGCDWWSWCPRTSLPLQSPISSTRCRTHERHSKFLWKTLKNQVYHRWSLTAYMSIHGSARCGLQIEQPACLPVSQATTLPATLLLQMAVTGGAPAQSFADG